MITGALPDGYTLGKPIHRSADRDVYVATRASDHKKVVVKVYSRTRSALESARSEYEAMRACAGPGIPCAYELMLFTDHPTLVMEWIPGISLAQWIRSGPADPALVLELAIQVVETLQRVHDSRWVHRDVSPANVMVDLEQTRAWLIDLGIATPLGSAAREHPAPSDETQAGTLLYIAPEQTGRMDRCYDYRSDLYTLGATLYHLLTGRPPFEESDTLALIHAHLARPPAPPHEVRPRIPEALSHLLLKLLRKEPEERYQSARALLADLRALQCAAREHREMPADFELGREDTPDRLRFSGRLYGRQRESEALRRGYARAARGEARAVFVRGPVGSGKSALVDVLRPEVTADRGYLGIGHFDAYTGRAYSGWVTALASVAHQVLLQSDAALAGWRAQLRAGLGSIARAMVDLIPDLGFVLGEVDSVPRLGPRQTRDRLKLALERTVRVFASTDHPLVLVLDDLHSSDPSSLALLRHMLQCPDLGALLIVGLYDSEEVDSSHAVAGLLEDIGDGDVPVETLTLAALEPDAALEMIGDALGRAPDEVAPLCEELGRKTGNSPLLIRQLLDHLCDRRIVYPCGGRWEWDSSAVAAVSIPDGAVGLITGKISSLPEPAVRLLRIASCIGEAFDVELLSVLSGRDRRDLEAPLSALGDAGLIVPSPQGFRFAHDRIRDTAQSLLPQGEHARLCYEVGSWLLQRTPEADRAQRSAEIAGYLNRGREHLCKALRPTLIELNCQAGRSALRAGAVPEANRFLRIACELFRAPDWSEHRELGFRLLLTAADAAFQAGDFERSLELLDQLDAQHPEPSAAARIAVKRIQIRALTDSAEACSAYALSALAELGVHWPLHPSPRRARWELWRVRRLLRGRSSEVLLTRATRVDPEWLVPTLLLAPAAGVFMQVDCNLAALAASRALGCFARHGFVGTPGFALAAFALCSLQASQNAEQARHDAQIATEWIERLPDPLQQPRARLTIAALIHPWLMPRRQALAPLDVVAQEASEIGDLEYAYYARRHQCLLYGLCGDPVPSIAERFERLVEQVRRSGQSNPEAEYGQRIYALLLSEALETEDLERELQAIEALLTRCQPSAAIQVRTLWMQLLCIYDRPDLAFEQSERVYADLFRIAPYGHVADHCFYRGVAAAALAERDAGRLRRGRRRALRECARRLAHWARGGPDFAHMAQLLEAEIAALRGHRARAAVGAELAARRATERQYPHHAALAYERRAYWLRQIRRESEASASHSLALGMYRKWESPAKLALLQRGD